LSVEFIGGKLDSRLRVCCQTILGGIEIATACFAGLAMTKNGDLCHCEERSDEAISTSATSPCAGMTKSDTHLLETAVDNLSL